MTVDSVIVYCDYPGDGTSKTNQTTFYPKNEQKKVRPFSKSYYIPRIMIDPHRFAFLTEKGIVSPFPMFGQGITGVTRPA